MANLRSELERLQNAQVEPTQDELETMREMLPQIDKLIDAATKAQSAGIDTADNIQELRDVKARISNILRVYG